MLTCAGQPVVAEAWQLCLGIIKVGEVIIEAILQTKPKKVHWVRSTHKKHTDPVVTQALIGHPKLSQVWWNYDVLSWARSNLNSQSFKLSRVNKNNSNTNTTVCSEFLAFLKPFSMNCHWRMLSITNTYTNTCVIRYNTVHYVSLSLWQKNAGHHK